MQLLHMLFQSWPGCDLAAYLEILEDMIKQESSRFANGRSVRRMFEQVQINQANRLMQQPGTTPTQAELRMILTADIEVVLQ